MKLTIAVLSLCLLSLGCTSSDGTDIPGIKWPEKKKAQPGEERIVYELANAEVERQILSPNKDRLVVLTKEYKDDSEINQVVSIPLDNPEDKTVLHLKSGQYYEISSSGVSAFFQLGNDEETELVSFDLSKRFAIPYHADLDRQIRFDEATGNTAIYQVGEHGYTLQVLDKNLKELNRVQHDQEGFDDNYCTYTYKYVQCMTEDEEGTITSYKIIDPLTNKIVRELTPYSFDFDSYRAINDNYVMKLIQRPGEQLFAFEATNRNFVTPETLLMKTGTAEKVDFLMGLSSTRVLVHAPKNSVVMENEGRGEETSPDWSYQVFDIDANKAIYKMPIRFDRLQYLNFKADIACGRLESDTTTKFECVRASTDEKLFEVTSDSYSLQFDQNNAVLIVQDDEGGFKLFDIRDGSLMYEYNDSADSDYYPGDFQVLVDRREILRAVEVCKNRQPNEECEEYENKIVAIRY